MLPWKQKRDKALTHGTPLAGAGQIGSIFPAARTHQGAPKGGQACGRAHCIVRTKGSSARAPPQLAAPSFLQAQTIILHIPAESCSSPLFHGIESDWGEGRAQDGPHAQCRSIDDLLTDALTRQRAHQGHALIVHARPPGGTTGCSGAAARGFAAARACVHRLRAGNAFSPWVHLPGGGEHAPQQYVQRASWWHIAAGQAPASGAAAAAACAANPRPQCRLLSAPVHQVDSMH